LIATIILLVATFILSYIEHYADVIKGEEDYVKFIDFSCEEPMTQYSWTQYNKTKENIGCTCTHFLDTTELNSIELFEKQSNFKDSTKNEIDQLSNLCGEYVYLKTLQYAFVFAVTFSTIFINMFIEWLFVNIVYIEKRRSKSKEAKALFVKIIVLQFIDTALINLVVNVKWLNLKTSGPVDHSGPIIGAMNFLRFTIKGLYPSWLPKILEGDHIDFSTDWYEEVGKPFTRILWLNIILQFDLIGVLFTLCKRFRDRKWSSKMTDEDGDINTKLKTHKDVVELYDQEEMSSYGVFAANTTFIMCAMMYSTGIPVFYCFSFVFMLMNYWMFKWLLLRYYRKAVTFNENLAIDSVWYLKVGLIIHAAMAILMLSNPSVLLTQP
jgi:hypothetical protein